MFRRPTKDEVTKGEVIEIFDSIQGEGVHVGCRQIFIRLAGCNLHCSYCDTPGEPIEEMTVDEVMAQVGSLLPFPLHSVSITGGEPLLQAPFTHELCKTLQDSGRKVYLETNGTLPDQMCAVNQDVDFVVMDVKLEEAGGQSNQFEVNQTFLRYAYDSGRNKVVVKVIITPSVTLKHLLPVVRMVLDVNPSIPVVLQPETSMGFSTKYLELQKGVLTAGLVDVRVVPQVHRYIGVL